MASSTSTAPAPSYTKLVNIYYERKAGTERPCYVCRMPTTTVLSTLNTEDFIYACPKHLTDSATAIPEPTVTGPSASDIAKVVEEHKAREERKQAKEKSKDDQSNEKGKDTLAKKDGEKGNASPANVVKQSDSPSTPAKGHRRYELHRALFTMRQRELRTREQAVHAKERSKGLPQVPRGTI